MSMRPSAVNLKELVLQIYQREKNRDELTMRRACLLVSQDHEDHGWRKLSEKERATFCAAGNGEKPLNAVLLDERLRRILYFPPWYESAKTEILKEESRRLNRTQFKETSWQVTRSAFADGARQLIPQPSYSVGWATVCEQGFQTYCEWLVTRDGTLPERIHEAFRILEDEGFCEELLSILWNECPEESLEMKLPPSEAMSGEAIDAGETRGTNLVEQWESATKATERANRLTDVGRDWTSYWRAFCQKYGVKTRPGRKKDGTLAKSLREVELLSIIRAIDKNPGVFEKATSEIQKRRLAIRAKIEREHGLNPEFLEELRSPE